MGDFQRFTTETLFDIRLKNAKSEPLGRIRVTGFYHNSEDSSDLTREDLRKSPPGPASRRIISTLQSVNFLGAALETAGEKDIKILNGIVESLTEHQGLQLSDKTIVTPLDGKFQEALTLHLRTKFNILAEYMK